MIKANVETEAAADFEAALKGEHIAEARRASVLAVLTGLSAISEAQRLREGEQVREGGRYFTVLGAADFFGCDPAVIRRAVRESDTPYALCIDEQVYLDEAGMVRVGRWIRDHVWSKEREQ